MKRSEVNKESGSVLVETALIAPILILLIFFGVDLLVYSQGKTVVTQIARESTIYLATVPGTLVSTTPFENVRSNYGYEDWSQACSADYQVADCPHLHTQIRVYRMIASAKGFLDPGPSSITTTYSTEIDGNFVSVAVNVPIHTFFGMMSGNVQRTTKLRRVNT